jgi:diaminopimelate decarboxylase
MGIDLLVQGCRTVVDATIDLNRATNGQITHIDIGGGKPANYLSDALTSPKVPGFAQYAAELRKAVPELFSGDFSVATEFGQAISSKSGFLASRIEWVKGTEEKPILMAHFGADSCVRQIYGAGAHERRIEGYRASGAAFAQAECDATGFVYGEANSSTLTPLAPRDPALEQLPFPHSVGGPLCFQGDFTAKDVRMPNGIGAGDLVVMKDAGAYTHSMFSRHCSRLCPAVYGYRWNRGAGTGAAARATGSAEAGVSFHLLKPQESLESLTQFWGPLLPSH